MVRSLLAALILIWSAPSFAWGPPIPFSAPVTISQSGGLAGYQIVGTRTGYTYQLGSSQVTAGNITTNSYQRVVLPYGATDIRVVYQGFTLNSSLVEAPIPVSVYIPCANLSMTGQLSGCSVTITNTSASGFAVGDTITMTASTPTSTTPCKFQVTAVSSGVPTQVQMIEPGYYTSPLAANSAAASTSGSGTGTITFSFSWVGAAYVANVSVVNPYVPIPVGSTILGWYSQGTLGVNGAGAAEYFIPVPSGGYAVSDSMPVNVTTPGTAIGLLTWAMGPRWWFGKSTQSGLGEWTNNNANTISRAQTGSAITAPTTAVMAIYPIMIIGHVPAPSAATPSVLVGVCGDSIAAATYSINGGTTGQDTGDTDGNYGVIERGLASKYAFANFSTGGDAIANWVSGASMRMNILRSLYQQGVRFDVGIEECITNDSGSVATMEANLQTIYKFMEGIGIKNIIQATPPPRTASSTDNWATSGSANQTQSANSTNRSQVSADLRNGTFTPTIAPKNFCIADMELIAMGSAGSSARGYWLGANDNGAVNSTYDGVHPTLAFEQTMAGAFNTTTTPSIASCLAVNF